MYVTSQPSLGALHNVLDADDVDQKNGRLYDRHVVSRLPRYLARVKSWMALGALGVIVGSLGSLALPYLLAVIVDSYIQTGNLGGLNVLVVLFVGASLLVWAGQYVEDRFLWFAGDRIVFILRTEMFDQLQRLSLSFYDRNKVGKIMSRVQSDVQQLQQLITSGILSIVTNALTLVAIAAVMFVMEARLALITFTVLPVLAAVTMTWQKYARRSFARVRRAVAVVNGQLQEGISGVRVVQSLSREENNLRQFESVNRAYLDANLRATRLTSATMPVVGILTATATALVVAVGGYGVLEGQIGVGVLLGFLLYVQRFFNPVLELAAEYTEFQRAMVAGARIFELLDTEPEIKDSPDAVQLPAVRGDVEFRQVSFGYVHGNYILHDIDLIIKAGETVAIVGPTGAGKSSLVSLICRFYEVCKGSISIDGHDTGSVTQQSLRRQIGLVPQDPFLFTGTIEDNVRYGHTEATHEDVVGAAKAAGADVFISRLEVGYSTQVGERGINLSAGQRQLVCLARAILGDPPILILDEATSSIDTAAERFMQKSLQSLVRGRTCIIVAHRLSTVVNADRIIVLDKGRIVEQGSHRDLLTRRGLYYRMFESLTDPDKARRTESG